MFFFEKLMLRSLKFQNVKLQYFPGAIPLLTQASLETMDVIRSEPLGGTIHRDNQ